MSVSTQEPSGMAGPHSGRSGLSATAFKAFPHCGGHRWVIRDEDHLARLVADLLTARYDHVARVLSGVDEERPPVARTVLTAVLLRKLRKPTSDVESYHRDGLLFQHIAWVAAAQGAEAGDLFSIPHVRTADKGQDMLVVHTGGKASSLGGVTICEDKATDDGRGTVRDDVFPEIQLYESGQRDDELQSATLAVLQRGVDKARAISLVQDILWHKLRRYRILVTIGAADDSPAGRSALFRGFEHAAPGRSSRRRGDTFTIERLREWFDEFADRVSAILLSESERRDV